MFMKNHEIILLKIKDSTHNNKAMLQLLYPQLNLSLFLHKFHGVFSKKKRQTDKSKKILLCN